MFGVAGVAAVTLEQPGRLTTSNVEAYRLQGLGGDDTFNVTPVAGIAIAVEGDEPGASDVLNYTAVNATVVNLGTSSIDDTVLAPSPNVTYSGIETINLNASSAALTVQTTVNDDTLVVTPFGGNAGRLQNNGVAPVVNYTNAAGNAVVVDLPGGEDTLLVNGTALG